MERYVEAEILPLCEELNIGFVAYSPMAGGFLSGKYSRKDKFEGDDVRRVITRFAKENMDVTIHGDRKDFGIQKLGTIGTVATH